MGTSSKISQLTLTENARLLVEFNKNVRISKYIQHDLLCTIWSQMCLVYTVELRLNIKPRAFSICVSISMYIARKSYVSEWGKWLCRPELYTEWGVQLVWSYVSFIAVNWRSKLLYRQRAVAMSSQGVTKIFKLYIH